MNRMTDERFAIIEAMTQDDWLRLIRNESRLTETHQLKFSRELINEIGDRRIQVAKLEAKLKRVEELAVELESTGSYDLSQVAEQMLEAIK